MTDDILHEGDYVQVRPLHYVQSGVRIEPKARQGYLYAFDGECWLAKDDKGGYFWIDPTLDEVEVLRTQAE